MNKKFIVFLLIFQLLSVLLSAEAVSKSKDYALQFTVDKNFALSGYDGTALSIKKQISEKSAIRFGVSTMFFREHIDKYEYFENIDWSYEMKNAEEKYNKTLLEFNLNYIFEFNKQKCLSWYLGSGAYYIYDRTYQGLWRDNEDYFRFYEVEIKEREYGISGIIGIEWNFYKNFSLTSEYNLNFGYAKIEENKNNFISTDIIVDEKNSSTGNEFRLDSKPVKLGLSVYF